MSELRLFLPIGKVDAAKRIVYGTLTFTSAPAIFSQVACEVRRHRQFTKPSPILLAGGLMCRLRMLLSRIGAPLLRTGTPDPRGRPP